MQLSLNNLVCEASSENDFAHGRGHTLLQKMHFEMSIELRMVQGMGARLF